MAMLILASKIIYRHLTFLHETADKRDTVLTVHKFGFRQ